MGRYNKIRREDISNGPGIRVSIFLQGCSFHCEGCFNQNTWDFNGGKEFTQEKLDELMSLCGKEYILGLSVLGGEPLHPANIPMTLSIVKRFKELYPNKNIWLWSGFKFEYVKNLEIMNYLDVLIDGQFRLEEFDPNLYYCGSANQRVIDVQKSLQEDTIVLYK